MSERAGKSVRRIGSPEGYLPVLLLLCLIVLPHLLPNPFYVHIVVTMLIFVILGGAWNILSGYAGQLSLGHAAFFGTGAYASTLLVNAYGISPWITLWIGGISALLLSLPMGLICFRLQGPYFTIATIGLAEALRLLVLHFREITNGAQGLTVPFKGDAPWQLQFDSKLPYYYVALAMAIAVLLITRRMESSRLGHYLVAIGQNQDAAEALGIDSAKAKRRALALSAFLTGVGGVFYAQYTYVIHPDSAFGLGISIQIALVAIVGGVGTILGPAIGAVIMEFFIQSTQVIFAGQYPGLELMVYGGLLVAVILWRPRGVFSWFHRLYQGLVARLPTAAGARP
ncbi:MAG TPA: branched-chain amino acid ABC transporter permease [Candidatus Methylomirabilis sp.]|nr:branched-chain amino acid ABC transporter permease [Candidatus Methylomirabilis sp.]